jgi:hypothetical protein
MNTKIELDLESYANYELEKQRRFKEEEISNSIETQSSRVFYSYYVLTCSLVYLGFGLYLVFMKPIKRFKQYLLILQKTRKYRRLFFRENSYLKFVRKSRQYSEFKNDLVNFILNDKQPFEVNPSFLKLEAELSKSESSNDSSESSINRFSSEESVFTKSSSSNSYSYRDCYEKTTIDYEMEDSETSRESSTSELFASLDTCKDLGDLTKIADLYAKFCAYLDVIKRSSYIPDSKIFLEWFLIKQLASKKHSQIRRAKKSIYSY